jgi:hypothetical protein
MLNPMVRAAKGLPPVPKVRRFGPLAKKGESKMKMHRAPAAAQSSYSTVNPSFNGGKAIVIRHREYLQNIISVTTFTGAGRYIVQPGLTDNFPWLGQVAGSFENYLFTDLRYIYVNRCPSSTSGNIYCAMQYDVSDPEFKTVEEIMTYGGASSEVAWDNFSYNAKLKRGEAYKKYLVRTDDLASGQDPQPFDTALFTICGVSGTAGIYLGDLMVEYTVKLWNPKMNPALLGAYGVTANMTAASVSVYVAAPLVGYNAAKASKFPSGVQEPVVDEAKQTVTFPSPGTYDIGFHIHDPGSTAQIWPSTSDLWALIDSAKGVLSVNNNIASTNKPTAGYGWTSWAKLAVTVANCALQFGPLTGSGTASNVRTILTIAVESAPYVLDYLNQDPVPPSPVQFASLKKAFPHHDFNRMEKRINQVNEESLVAKHFGEQERKLRAFFKENPDASLGDFYSRHSPVDEKQELVEEASVEPDEEPRERSRSRDPDDKKSKKSDFKQRKLQNSG